MEQQQKLSLISQNLQNVEDALKKLELWALDEEGRPDDEAFLSSIPFCLDTMEFHQWLQFVLLPKMRELLQTPSSLPKKMAIHAAAEEYYRGKWREYRSLLNALRKLDALFL